MRVIFLGAGASKAMGLPITGELLPLMIAAAQNNTLFAHHKNAPSKREELLQIIIEMVPGSATKATQPSIVDVLSLLDFALTEGFTLFHTGGAAKLRRARELLESGLLGVLAQCQMSQKYLSSLQGLCSRDKTCLITTNYDSLIDLAIRAAQIPIEQIDYGMPWRNINTGLLQQRPMSTAAAPGPLLRFFKLHGSVNWLGCPYCQYIYINQEADIASLDIDTDTNLFGLASTCHCDYAPLRRVIVSPSLSRGSYQTHLRTIHLAALEALRLADEVYLVGYSLPMEDLLVRSLLLRAFSAQTRNCKIQVYQ